MGLNLNQGGLKTPYHRKARPYPHQGYLPKQGYSWGPHKKQILLASSKKDMNRKEELSNAHYLWSLDYLQPLSATESPTIT